MWAARGGTLVVKVLSQQAATLSHVVQASDVRGVVRVVCPPFTVRTRPCSDDWAHHAIGGLGETARVFVYPLMTETLFTRLTRYLTYPWDEIMHVRDSLKTLIDGLWEQGVAHCDVKLANIFRHRGEYLLGDFDLAHFRDGDVAPLTCPKVYSPGYRRVTWEAQVTVDLRDEYYALGVCLLELWLGVPGFLVSPLVDPEAAERWAAEWRGDPEPFLCMAVFNQACLFGSDACRAVFRGEAARVVAGTDFPGYLSEVPPEIADFLVLAR